TRSKRDWSSDVCSSDLMPGPDMSNAVSYYLRGTTGSIVSDRVRFYPATVGSLLKLSGRCMQRHFQQSRRIVRDRVLFRQYWIIEIGRASCRERVGVSVV